MLGKDISASAKNTKKWLKELHWIKILLVAVIYTVLSTVIRQVEAKFTMRYYLMPQYFGVWSKFMMPTAGPPSTEFMIISLTTAFYSGMALSLIYYYVKNLLPKLFWNRVFFFADLMIATSFLFFTLPSFLLFNLPLGLIISWFISSFIILVLASFVIVKIIG